MKRLILGILLLLPLTAYSQQVDQYLILSDIGGYKYRPKQTHEIFGNSGTLIAAGHFFLDHNDVTYSTRYVHPETILGVSVEVTQHAGTDSDKWLLHEVEDAYRDSNDDDRRLGLLSGAGVKVREIGSNRLYYWGLGGGSYSWISTNKVIEINYVDLQRTKPEPLEVVQAYLQKFPSTISGTLVLDRAHDEEWIKDEMERRLWLCDKWFGQLDQGKVQVDATVTAVLGHLNTFLDYREKYYGVSTGQDKQTLYGYMTAKNDAGMRIKLAEYKRWWSDNKTKPISLP